MKYAYKSLFDHFSLVSCVLFAQPANETTVDTSEKTTDETKPESFEQIKLERLKRIRSELVSCNQKFMVSEKH